MLPDDQSFTDLLEACSQNLGKRARAATSNGAANHGRGRAPRYSDSSASNSSGGRDDELLNTLARLTLRQEDALTQLSLDKSFMFFTQRGRGSIMPSMLTKAREWNSRKQSGDVSTPLRITMLLHCFQELAHRAKQLQVEAKDVVMNLRSNTTAQGQQDTATDIRGAPHAAGTDCASWTTTVGSPQVLGAQTSECENLP